MRNAKDNEPLVLVAGGAGFIGSHLCERLLADGFAVLCLDNLQTGCFSNIARLVDDHRFTFVRGDIVDALPGDVMARATSISWIFNLACPASPPKYQEDPEHTMLTNVVGTNRLLRLAESTGARILLSSTSEVYGDPEVHPQHEGYRGNVSFTGVRACYDEGKRAAETLAFDFARLGRADVRIARLFNTYGPRMQPDDGRVVPNFICQALSGRDITVFGSGDQTRSLCYISDMIDGLLALMRSPLTKQAVNLGNPNEITVGDLAELVLRITASPSRIVYHPLPHDDPTRRRPDITLARAALNWDPHVPLEDGLSRTCAWFTATPASISAET